MTEVSETVVLTPLRQRIDAIDAAMVDLLAERVRVVQHVIELKQRHAIPARLTGRVEAVVANVRAKAEATDCPPALAEEVWRTMIEWIIDFEEGHLRAAPLRHPE